MTRAIGRQHRAEQLLTALPTRGPVCLSVRWGWQPVPILNEREAAATTVDQLAQSLGSARDERLGSQAVALQLAAAREDDGTDPTTGGLATITQRLVCSLKY